MRAIRPPGERRLLPAYRQAGDAQLVHRHLRVGKLIGTDIGRQCRVQPQHLEQMKSINIEHHGQHQAKHHGPHLNGAFVRPGQSLHGLIKPVGHFRLELRQIIASPLVHAGQRLTQLRVGDVLDGAAHIARQGLQGGQRIGQRGGKLAWRGVRGQAVQVLGIDGLAIAGRVKLGVVVHRLRQMVEIRVVEQFLNAL